MQMANKTFVDGNVFLIISHNNSVLLKKLKE